ncbi:hypothetical protein J6590_059077 [Homalodisca vitripennis]|nr:hypothetical protein J6590_059077 [Homalodisca vitripennis]
MLKNLSYFRPGQGRHKDRFLRESAQLLSGSTFYWFSLWCRLIMVPALSLITNGDHILTSYLIIRHIEIWSRDSTSDVSHESLSRSDAEEFLPAKLTVNLGTNGLEVTSEPPPGVLLDTRTVSLSGHPSKQQPRSTELFN